MAERLSKRVLLIGWDAADWRTIRPLMDAGRMPNLLKMVESGVSGNLATLMPVLSPILWNSIATGKLADKHGILGFIEPDGQGAMRPVSSTSRKAKAIWNILSQHDLRSIVVGWYASHPAEPINGVIVTDRYEHTSGEKAEKFPLDARAIHPPELFDELAALQVNIGDITAEQVLPFIPEAHLIDQSKDKHLPALALLLSECATIHNAATHLIETQEWDFAAIYYDAIDHFAHGFMEFHPPKMAHVTPEQFRLFRHVMEGCYQFHDLMLGRLLELAGPDTTVILLSDHGFFSDDLRPTFTIDPQTGAKSGPGVNPVAWHRLQGVLAMSGPPIVEDELLHGAGLLDIAPTVLSLLGVAPAEDMDGRVLTKAFKSPPEITPVDTYEAPHDKDGVHRDDFEDDVYSAHEVFKRLAELGYVESADTDNEAVVERALADRVLNLAQVYASSFRFQEVLDTLLPMIDTPNDSVRVRSRIAMALISLGRIGEAEQYLSPHMGKPGEYPLAELLYAQVLMAKGEIEEALALLTRVRASNPRLPHLHAQLGRAHLHRGAFSTAEGVFQLALDIDGDSADAHEGMGVALAAQDKYAEALYHFMRSVTLEHNQPMTHTHLGLCAARVGEFAMAQRALEIAIELNPQIALPHRLLARLYKRRLNNPEAARQHARRARELRRDGRRGRRIVPTRL